jgi:hypothetical protein
MPSSTIRPRPRALAAWSVTLAIHLVLAERLLVGTRALPPSPPPARMAVEIRLDEPLPPPPAQPAAGSPVIPVRAAEPPRRPSPTALEAPSAAPSPFTRADPLAEPESAVLARQARAAASQYVREHPQQRAPFAGRDLDAMVPDADQGVLPGFRPRAEETGPAQLARRLAGMAGAAVPQAASDHDAMSDQLIGGWWAGRDHGDDTGPCRARTGALDAETARALCLGKPLPARD